MPDELAIREEYVRQEARKIIDGIKDPAHDWAHTVRVKVDSLTIGETIGADPMETKLIVWGHDIGYGEQLSTHGETRHEDFSAVLYEPILKRAGYGNDLIQRVLYGIRNHTYSICPNPTSPELMAVQDADRIDTIGIIGIFRAAAYSTFLKRELFDQEDPFAIKRERDSEAYALDDILLRSDKIIEKLHTLKGKEIFARRLEFMRDTIEILRLALGPYIHAT